VELTGTNRPRACPLQVAGCSRMLVHVFFRGGFGGRVIPGLFSNPVVKSSYADGTALWWGGRVGCCHGLFVWGWGFVPGWVLSPPPFFLFGWVCEHVKVGVCFVVDPFFHGLFPWHAGLLLGGPIGAVSQCWKSC